MRILRYIPFLLLLFLLPVSVSAQSSETNNYKGEIVESIREDCSSGEFICVKYIVKILDGDLKGNRVESIVSAVNTEKEIFKDGKKVYISSSSVEGEVMWNVESYSRETGLFILLLVFISLILLTTGRKGLRSVLGLGFTFVVLYFFAIPNINYNENIGITTVALLTILALLFVSTFITYGFNRKSFIAFASSSLGVLFIFLLGSLVVNVMDINGTGEESATMLYDTISRKFSLSTIYLIGIVIGALGVLDDVTIGQTSSMMEIYDANKTLTSRELYLKTMKIGKDHISSMINTLFIAYAGSSFTLVMLLSANNPEFRILINTEFIVEEIVRTLVASIGLMLIVPVTTYIASKMVVNKGIN